jgi:hypothetical protein
VTFALPQRRAIFSVRGITSELPRIERGGSPPALPALARRRRTSAAVGDSKEVALADFEMVRGFFSRIPFVFDHQTEGAKMRR